MITLRQLEIFVQVVDHGSFRRCADRIGISAVSVSEHIRELEKRLDRPLFEREPGGAATLTVAGRSAYERSLNILADVANLIGSIDGAPGPAQRLKAIIHPFIGRHLLDCIARFREQHPETMIEVDLSNRPAKQLVELVRNRQLDLAYFLVLGVEDAPDTELIAEEPMGFFVARHHALARVECVDIADLAAVPAVLLGAANPLRELTDRVMALVGLGHPKIVLETDEYGLILASVAQGMGHVCMFASNADTPAHGLVPLKTCFPVPPVQVRAAAARSIRDSAVLRELHALLTATYRGMGHARA